MSEKNLVTDGPWKTPARVRAAFFDVDGTMLSHRLGTEPASTREAIARLAEAGVMPILATGRTSYLLDLVDLTGFGALVTFNGQYCYDSEGTPYRDCPIDERDAHRLVEMAQDGSFDLYVMHRDDAFVSRRSERVLEVERRTDNHFAEGPLERALDEPVYQFCVYVDPGEEGVFMDHCEHVEHTRWCELFCDVIPAGGGKPAGIAATLERFGLTPEECVAFGDGGNDVPMFGCVGTSVAMGNAGDDVKAAASMVAPDVDEDGLLVACQRLGLA